MLKKLNNYDIYELISVLCNIKEEKDEYELETDLYNKYEINIENFGSLINDLLPLCEVGFSPITENKYCGFAKKNDKFWIIKILDNDN